ncbi:SDR family NAD(P)-dependent oxidoreductase [Microbacterium sp.]|uniref:SDR family NAD(P)-dependent oxidoreductase n=1 Tax=Microbacterium sp. TaxID=51671 RepID=UPI003A849637
MSRTAVVTAGAGGIGLEIARRLQHDGFDVVAMDVDLDAGARSVAEGRRFLPCDFADEQAVRGAFAAVGAVHTLVNNVGIRGATGAVWDIPIGDFRQTLDVNTVSHVLAAQQVIPGMRERGEGCIVQIASGAARTGAVGRAPYGLSKWALLGLTKSLANELAPWGIRANAVLPGIIKGERFEGSIALHAQEEGITREEALERIMSRTRLKRFIEPAEIAAAVAYLVSDDAVGVTGAFLDVTGGFE